MARSVVKNARFHVVKNLLLSCLTGLVMLTLVVGFAVGWAVVGKLCDGNLGLSLTAFFFCLIGGPDGALRL